MDKLNELVEMAKASDGKWFATAINPESILAIAEAFRELEQRAEAAEAKVIKLNEGWLTAIAQRDEARVEQGKLAAARGVKNTWKERAWSAEEKLAELAKQTYPKAVVRHYTGCKYPVIKINSLEVVIAGEREDAEELAEYVNSMRSAPAAVPTKDQIREVFMRHGFTVKEGQSDLKPYVYDAAYALFGTSPVPAAVPVELVPCKGFLEDTSDESVLIWQRGWNACRDEMLRRIEGLKK